MSQNIHNDGNWQRVDTGAWVSRAEHERVVADNLRLQLLTEHANTYWHDGDTEYEDPTEFACENRVPVGHVFPLQAAAYWPVEFRVSKADEDNDDYEVEQVPSTRRAEFPEYFKIKADFDAQATRIAELDSQLRAMTADRDLWKDDHEGDCPHVARIAELEAERDELECKGKDLCCAYGNALITIHDLREQNARLVEALNSERKDETGRISMEYEVVQDKRHPQDYRAEAIGADGECYSVVFIGPDAEKRAREYALAQKEQG